MRSMSHPKLSVRFHGMNPTAKIKIITHPLLLKKKILGLIFPRDKRLINQSEAL